MGRLLGSKTLGTKCIYPLYLSYPLSLSVKFKPIFISVAL